MVQLPLLAHIYFFSCCVPIIAGLPRVRHMDGPMRLLYLAVQLSLAFTLAELWVSSMKMHNLWLLHLFSLIHFTIVSIVVSYWTQSQNLRTRLRWLAVAFGVVWIIAKFTFEPMTEWNEYTSTIYNVLLIVISMYMFFTMNKEHTFSKLLKSRFWILASIMFLAAGDLLLFAFGNKIILMTKAEFIIVYKIHWGANTISNLMMAYALWCYPGRETAEIETRGDVPGNGRSSGDSSS